MNWLKSPLLGGFFIRYRNTIGFLSGAWLGAWACSPAAALSVVGERALKVEESHLSTALIDSGQGMAYFAASPSDFAYSLAELQSKIIQIRTSDLTLVQTLTLPAGETPLTCSAWDPARGLAYFGVPGDPNRALPGSLVQVRLAGLRRIGAIPLGPQDSGVASAAIAPDGGTVYLGTLFGSVVGVQAPALTLIGNIILKKEQNAFRTALVDPSGRSGYFGTASGNVLQLRLSDFSPQSNLTVLRGPNGFRAAVIDRSGEWAYFGAATSPGRIYRIRLADLGVDGALTLEPQENGMALMLLDPARPGLIVATAELPARLVRIDLADFSRRDFLVLPRNLGRVTCGALDGKGFAYLGTDAKPARILKIKL